MCLLLSLASSVPNLHSNLVPSLKLIGLTKSNQLNVAKLSLRRTWNSTCPHTTPECVLLGELITQAA